MSSNYLNRGKDTCDEVKEAVNVLRQALTNGRTGAQVGSTITPRRVASTVQSTAQWIASAFGRRVVLFASSDPAALLPNEFIDKRDQMVINGKTLSDFEPTTFHRFFWSSLYFSEGGLGGNGRPPAGLSILTLIRS